MNQLREYKDGMQTDHRMQGTVIPRATNRAESGKGPVDNESLGADFDFGHPAEQVIVDCDAAGQTVKATRIDKEALARLAKANQQGSGRKGRIMGYDEAAKAPAGAAVADPEVVKAAAVTVALSSAETAAAAPAPKIKVIFAGAFGKISFSYSLVFFHKFFLVLVQESADGDFYEPPGEPSQPMQVALCDSEGRTYACFPCAHIPFPNGRTAVTILLVDEKEGESHGEDR